MTSVDLPIGICAVDTPDGTKHYVALTPMDVAFKRGLVPEAIVGVLLHPLQQGEAITSANFARNSVFVEFLHSVIASRGPQVPGLVAAAKQQGEGWVYVVDGRTPTPTGAVAPEDIIGAFQVSGGAIVPTSYQRNENHAILSKNGFMRLDASLQQHLLADLAARA